MFSGASRRKFVGSGLGFTLVELLVVIAVIAMIAAITFPVFVKAKQQAQIAQCLSNMRQLGAAIHLYNNQYDSHFPPATDIGVPWRTTDNTIQELLNTYVRNGLNPVRTGTTGFIYPYKSVFCCPSDIGIAKDDDGYRSIKSGRPVWLQTGCSYRYYANIQADYLRRNCPQVPWSALSPEVLLSAVKTGPKTRLGAPESAVISPTRKAVLGDVWFWHLGDQVPPKNEVAFQNTLFADGHAKRVRGEDHIQSRIQSLRRDWHPYTETGN